MISQNMKKLAEDEMINMEKLAGMDTDLPLHMTQTISDDVINQVASTMTDAEKESLMSAVDTGGTYYRTPETDLERDPDRRQESAVVYGENEP